ncbi:MAG TPA: hypothetical protein VME17_01175 [Bryobacteraceae bacterium]|nr:hypothetical protein [Bryobacteraceae bacterium]
MRILAVLAIATLCFVSLGCSAGGMILQPPQQGEWSNFHNDKHQVSQDVRDEAAQPPADK